MLAGLGCRSLKHRKLQLHLNISYWRETGWILFFLRECFSFKNHKYTWVKWMEKIWSARLQFTGYAACGFINSGAKSQFQQTLSDLCEYHILSQVDSLQFSVYSAIFDCFHCSSLILMYLVLKKEKGASKKWFHLLKENKCIFCDIIKHLLKAIHRDIPLRKCINANWSLFFCVSTFSDRIWCIKHIHELLHVDLPIK